MSNRIKVAFLLLIISQGLHSWEEYAGKLWETFPPARYLTSLVSPDAEWAFLILNIGLIAFGLGSWCWVAFSNGPFARAILWFWVILEMINGVGHPIWTLAARAYVPGVGTAPLLLILSIYLARRLSQNPLPGDGQK